MDSSLVKTIILHDLVCQSVGAESVNWSERKWDAWVELCDELCQAGAQPTLEPCEGDSALAMLKQHDLNHWQEKVLAMLGQDSVNQKLIGDVDFPVPIE